jgi:hypothetical protein
MLVKLPLPNPLCSTPARRLRNDPEPSVRSGGHSGDWLVVVIGTAAKKSRTVEIRNEVSPVWVYQNPTLPLFGPERKAPMRLPGPES